MVPSLAKQDWTYDIDCFTVIYWDEEVSIMLIAYPDIHIV